MAGAAVRARGWSYHHAGRADPVLAEVDLEVRPGELVLVVGASGSGKSTLLGGLAGSLPAEGASGTLAVEPAGASVGAVGQQPEGNIVMERVGDDVAFPLENAGVPAARIWPRVTRALSDVGLDVPLDRDTSRLSGGQQQLLALASALVLRPGLLLLDEPTANLDAASADRLRDAVLALRGSCTIVVIEHRLRGWIEHADRVLVVAGGRVQDVGDARGLRGALAARPELARNVWTGDWHPPDLRPTSQWPSTPPTSTQRPSAEGPSTGPVQVALEAERVGVAGRLRPTDLSVGTGEIVAITGAAGSGKSTLLACVSGLMRPDPGARVHVRGSGEASGRGPWQWSSAQVAATFGVVFQNPEHQFVTSRVVDELRHGLLASGVGHAEADARAADMLARLGLAGLAQANPFTLSGGEQRRLSVATSLVLDPRVLVLDEPTFGQDPATWEELARIIAAHRDAGGTVLMATHDQALVAALAATQVRLVPPADASEPGERRPTAAAAPEGTRVTAASGQAATAGAAAEVPTDRSTAGGPSPAQPGPVGRPASPVGLRRLSPLSLLGAASLLSAAALISASVALNLALAGAVLIGALLGRVPGRRLALLSVPALLATASVAISNALLSSAGPASAAAWQAAALPASRVLAVALPGLVTAAVLDPTGLADSLMVRLRVPPRAACAVLAALRLLPLLQAEWEVLGRASRARGLSGTGPRARARQFLSMTFRLLVAALRRGVRLASAMEARGMRGPDAHGSEAHGLDAADRRPPHGPRGTSDVVERPPRTVARPLQRSRGDLPVLLLGVLALAMAVSSRI